MNHVMKTKILLLIALMFIGSCRTRPDFVEQPEFFDSCKLDVECRYWSRGNELATCTPYATTCEKVLRFSDCQKFAVGDKDLFDRCLSEANRR